MVTTVTAIAAVIVLGAWHLRIRRHPAWAVDSHARFCIGSGHSMAVIAMYFIVESPSHAGWAWLVGLGWTAAAATAFAAGFAALNRVVRRQHTAAMSIETIPHTAEV